MRNKVNGVEYRSLYPRNINPLGTGPDLIFIYKEKISAFIEGPVNKFSIIEQLFPISLVVIL